MAHLLRSLQLPPADVAVAQQLATAKQVQVTFARAEKASHNLPAQAALDDAD